MRLILPQILLQPYLRDQKSDLIQIRWTGSPYSLVVLLMFYPNLIQEMTFPEVITKNAFNRMEALPGFVLNAFDLTQARTGNDFTPG